MQRCDGSGGEGFGVGRAGAAGSVVGRAEGWSRLEACARRRSGAAAGRRRVAGHLQMPTGTKGGFE